MHGSERTVKADSDLPWLDAGDTPELVHLQRGRVSFATSLMNRGAQGRGIGISVSGDALSNRLISLRSVQIEVPTSRGLSKTVAKLVPSGATMEATFPGFNIPLGVQDWSRAHRLPPPEMALVMESILLATVYVHLRGETLRSGRGRAVLSVVPSGNDRGGCEKTIDITVAKVPGDVQGAR